MAETTYRLLVRSALALTLAWIGWTLYDGQFQTSAPEARELAAAARYLEDGEYPQALAAYRRVLKTQPENSGAVRGEAQALMRLGIHQLRNARQRQLEGETGQAEILRQQASRHLGSALQRYDQAIAHETASLKDPRSLGVAYANRGILKDQMGDYPGALEDYREALRLEPELAEGPGLLTRFLRNQAERPPSVADRVSYLAEQLARPESERLMRVPEQDARQRAYTLD